jgi:hypothetical protein
MSRHLGAFDTDNDMIDRPDLNKCPDCGCFFAQDTCPLCGKICPEEMRAGNRKPPKKEKFKYANGFKAVQFVDWYHRWWFIALATWFFPLMGIVLLITSPHKKAHKILAVVIAVMITVLYSMAFPFIFSLINKPEVPVDTSLTKAEYISACEEVVPEDYYRSPKEYADKFITMELTVKRVVYVDEYYNATYNACYVCTDVSGSEFEIIIHPYLRENERNFLPGDVIRIYGEGNGSSSIYDNSGNTYSGPYIYVAYAE